MEPNETVVTRHALFDDPGQLKQANCHQVMLYGELLLIPDHAQYFSQRSAQIFD